MIEWLQVLYERLSGSGHFMMLVLLVWVGIWMPYVIWPKKFRRFFREWLPPWINTRWWQGHAYFSVSRGERLMVIYPFHWVVMFVFWLNYRWCKHRLRRSWIDREVTLELQSRRGIYGHANKPRT